MPGRRTRSVAEITDPLLGALTPVPRAAPGVCRICHGAPRAGYGECLSCHRTTSQVSNPTSLVVPISLYVIPSQLHAILWGYKNTFDEAVRRRQVVQVAAIVGHFLHGHRRCIVGAAGTDFDAITVVPSTQSRPGAHPLEQAIGLLSSLASASARLLEPIGEERHASDHAFEPLRSATGRSVLLVDDRRHSPRRHALYRGRPGRSNTRSRPRTARTSGRRSRAARAARTAAAAW